MASFVDNSQPNNSNNMKEISTTVKHQRSVTTPTTTATPTINSNVATSELDSANTIQNMAGSKLTDRVQECCITESTGFASESEPISIIAPGYKLEHLLQPLKLESLVKGWLDEDLSSLDYAGFIVGDKREVAQLICKQDCWIAGKPFVQAVFSYLGCACEWQVNDGEHVVSGAVVCKVSGCARSILLGERVALNILSRASGVATLTRHIKKLTRNEGWKGELAGTRKTTPGFRMVEKYALLVGGAGMHRYDLSTMIMIKDNHVWSIGGIKQAVELARSVGGFSSKVEVECRTAEEAMEAADAQADIIMLDNFSSQEIHQVAASIKERRNNVVIEASGGINETNIGRFCGPHIDVISMSQLTQGYPAIDFSLKIKK